MGQNVSPAWIKSFTTFEAYIVPDPEFISDCLIPYDYYY